MTIGPCRLFMMRMDESLEIVPGRPQVRRPDEERTRVLERPLHFPPPPGGSELTGEADQFTNRRPGIPARAW